MDRPPVCSYEGSDYQTSFWEQADRGYEDQVEGIALKRLLPGQGSLMLELGAGAGRNTPRFSGFQRVVLLDYAHTQLQQAQARLGRDDRYIYVVADIYNLPFVPGLFDAATMVRTLHHMADAPRALRQVSQVMAKDSVFILEYANKHNLKAITRYWLGRQDWSPFSPEPVEFVRLNFDFHPRTIRTWLAESGFAVEKQLTVSHFRLGLLKRALPLSWLVRMDALAQWTGDLWQLSPSVFVRSRVDKAPQLPEAGAFFRCPACGNYPLEETETGCPCKNCGRFWERRDGIYIFREEGDRPGGE